MYDAAVEVVDGQLVANCGETPYSRRLADKLLAAFNFAYAVGETDIADALRTLLKQLDVADHTVGENRRRHPSNVEQADLWAAFVEARNTYRATSAANGHDKANCEAALADMREAYRAWTLA